MAEHKIPVFGPSGLEVALHPLRSDVYLYLPAAEPPPVVPHTSDWPQTPIKLPRPKVPDTTVFAVVAFATVADLLDEQSRTTTIERAQPSADTTEDVMVVIGAASFLPSKTFEVAREVGERLEATVVGLHVEHLD
jgi:hypothetical protein